MADKIYETMLEAYQVLQEIVKTISETKFVIDDFGLSIAGYHDPKKMKLEVLQDMDTFFNLVDELSFFFADEQLGGIKNVAFKKLKGISIISQSEFRNSNLKPYFTEYREFRTTQKGLKNRFIKQLDDDRKLNIKSEKFTWKGTQRQLVELFEVLIDKEWIERKLINEHIPIVEMFNIKHDGKVVPIDEESFRVAFKPKNNHHRNPGNYKETFQKIPQKQ